MSFPLFKKANTDIALKLNIVIFSSQESQQQFNHSETKPTAQYELEYTVIMKNHFILDMVGFYLVAIDDDSKFSEILKCGCTQLEKLVSIFPEEK